MPILLIVLLGTYLMCWQGYKMRGRISGLGHIALILSLTATLANAATARLSAAHPHSAVTGQYIALVEHILVTVSVLGLYLFRLAVDGCTIHSRRVVLALGGGVAAASILAGLTLAALERGKLLSITASAYRDPVVFAYSFGASIYWGVLLVAVARWAIRYTRDKEKHFRRGMRITAVGLFAISALCFVRALPMVIVFLHGPEVVAPGFLLGGISAAAFPLVFIGLSYPLLVSRIAALRVWRRRRVTCARVNVVWSVCKTAYPEIVLRPRTAIQRLGHALWNPKLLERLTSESFDGLAKLLGHDEPARTLAAQVAANNLREAVRLYDETHPVKVWDLVSPDVDEAADVVPAMPEGDPDSEMLLALASILDDVLHNDQDPVRL